MLQQTNRVATYARVSTGMQAEDGKSLAAQKAEMSEFAQAHDWEIVAEFVDAGLSGTNMDRPGLKNALKAAEQGSYDILLVHELSRLSRRLYDTLGIFEKLGRIEVGFASVQEPNFNFSTPTGRLVLTMLAALNQYYVDLLKMHTAKSKRERARRGLYNASITPYGYEHVGDADTPPERVPEQAAIVEEMFEKYASGKYSFRQIADWMSDAGYRTRSGRRFSKDTVADMIRNPFYKGKVWYRQGSHSQDEGEIFDGQHEAIVSPQLWELCRRVRERRRTAPRTYQPQYRVYLLNGLVRCDICGRKLRAQGAKAGDYYREMSVQRGFLDCPVGGRGVRMEEIDRQVGAVFRELRLPSDWQDELAEMVEEEEELDTLQNRHARLVAERRRLKQMKIRGEFDTDPDLYRRERTRIQRELAELPAAAEIQGVGFATGVIEELTDTWDDAELIDRRDLLRLALRQIKVDVVQGRVVTIEPYPVFVPLFRELSFLQELGFGVFHPVWSEDEADALDVMETRARVTELPDPADVPDWPLVLSLPVDIVGKRITPMLSDWLKKRRRADKPLGPVVELANPRVPALKVDIRHWSEVTIGSVEDLSDVKDGAVGFLWTPFALQRAEDKAELVEEVKRVLEKGGRWAFVDVLPASMSGHWLYTYFSDAWENDTGLTWDAFELYNELRGAGFEVELERMTLQREMVREVAYEMVLERERCPQLAILPDETYEEGLTAFREAVKSEDDEALEISELTLVQLTADKG